MRFRCETECKKLVGFLELLRGSSWLDLYGGPNKKGPNQLNTSPTWKIGAGRDKPSVTAKGLPILRHSDGLSRNRFL